MGDNNWMMVDESELDAGSDAVLSIEPDDGDDESVITVTVTKSPEDEVLVVHIDTNGEREDNNGPLVRIHLNDETIFENPPYPYNHEGGDDAN